MSARRGPGVGLTRRELLGASGAVAGSSLLGCAACQPPELEHPLPWIWSGGLGPDRIAVRARVVERLDDERLVLRRAGGGGERAATPATRGASGILGYRVDGLAPDTAYRYAVGGMQGRFRTAPPPGPASFRVALASCADTRSSHPVFDEIRRRDPLFFLHMGDLHYRDIDTDDVDRFHRAYDETLASPAQARLYRSTPVAYVWDDHDFGPNDADRTAPGRRAAHAAFREAVPRHPLALEGAQAPIARAFTIGRVRWVITDLRSARAPHDVEPSRRTMLGFEQRRWLEAELVAASRGHALVVWVSSVPWLGDQGERDTWGGYAEERRRLADTLTEAGVQNLVMLSGDAHMLAIDDGRHNRFASRAAGPGFPIFQAAALDRAGSTKGGPYSAGAFPGGGQFGEMEVEDLGGTVVHLTWRGRGADGGVRLERRFSVPAA